MIIHESKACTCYGRATVSAQWNDQGQFRLIQVTEPRKGVEGWKGKVYYLPKKEGAGLQQAYFCRVFNLVAHSVEGNATTITEERTEQ